MKDPLHRPASWRFAVAIAAACACWIATAVASDRVALLIGNNTYAAAELRNAVNDAKDLGDTLKELGFKVIVKQNTTRKDMIDAIREFGTALDGANTAVFFYAGHAMQFKDRNYLIPIDAVMGSEEDVTFFSVEIGQVFDRMDRAKTRTNLIILDACRDNPFASSFKVTSAGLAQMSSPSGTLIAYATSPGSVAADGFGRNGIYTKHILQNIKVPDQPVEIMFKRVREGVERETRKLQTPWDSSSLKGDFAFYTAGRAESAGAGASSQGPSADTTLNIEREFWSSVRDSNRADDIQAYLEKYPKGIFAPLARNRLDALLRPTRVASAPAESRSASPATPAAGPAATPTVAESKPPVAASAEPRPAVVAAAVPATQAAASSQAPASAPPQPSSAVAAPAATPKPPEAGGREIAPGVRELSFPDGSIYRGGMRGTSIHGKGEYVSKAFQYQGEFKDGLKHGQGSYAWENGDRFEGEFVDDRPNGKGKYRFSTGDTYEGDVRAGVIVGRGVYLSKNGDQFEGSFASGKPNGTGIYRFASGDRYEGELVAGVLQGKGRYLSRNGDRIEGPFVDGKPHGQGVYYFSNGDRYEGDITQGALTGQGAYFYGSGQKYEGQMLNGQPQGAGIFWFADGSAFHGTFENGLAKARGHVVKTDGSKAAAEMVDGNVKWLP